MVKGPQGVFAIRYPTQGGLRQVSENWAMNRAATFAQWKAAMAMQAVPSINYVYADDKGNIGYLSNGMYPLRKEGAADWSGILPGDRSDLIWTKLRPFEASPHLWNPKSGWVFNSNNTPFRATDPASDLKPSDFPASQQLQPIADMTNRAYRALEIYGPDKAITARAFNDDKYDIAYSVHSDEFAWVKAVLAVDPKGDADLMAAQAALRGWDGKADLKSRGMGLVALMWLQTARALGLDAASDGAGLDPDPQEGLRPGRSGMGRGEPAAARDARHPGGRRARHLPRALRQP